MKRGRMNTNEGFRLQILMRNEEFLTEELSGECKKKFLDFVNAWGVVNGESNLDSFIMGFRLGANLHMILLYRPKHRLRS